MFIVQFKKISRITKSEKNGLCNSIRRNYEATKQTLHESWKNKS